MIAHFSQNKNRQNIYAFDEVSYCKLLNHAAYESDVPFTSSNVEELSNRWRMGLAISGATMGIIAGVQFGKGKRCW